MYESAFGFSGPPFQLNPDPAFYFNSRGHGRALAYLQYGVAQGEGFIVITGEIGAGKTTLVRMLLDGLDRQKVLPAQIVSTQLESGELLQSIITAFGIPSQNNTSKAHLIATLEAFLTALAAQGRHALLVVDEAQNLEPRAVEELRMLSNFQLGNHSLLQSFLVGQPELRRLLESPSMEQLRQRVTASCHLGPLSLEETQAYIEHRLRRVGWTQHPAFGAGAFESLYRWSGGVPRRLNRLANRVLLAAFLDGAEAVSADLIERTAGELRAEIGEGGLEVPIPVVAVAETPVVPAPPVPAAPAMTPSPMLVEQPVLTFIEPPPLVAPAAPEPMAPIASESPAPVVLDAPVTVEADDVEPPAEVEVEIELDAQSQAALMAPRLRSVSDAAVKAARVHAAGRLSRRDSRDKVFCLADSTSGALKFAALAQAMAEQGRSPRMMLVSLGPLPRVWPWSGMGRVLPAMEIGLDLEWSDSDPDASVDKITEGFGHFAEEYKPLAVVSLGSSDAMVACCLAAQQRGLPLIRLEAGERPAPARHGLNATLIEQMSDLLCVASVPSPLRFLARQGTLPERIACVPDQLRTDAVAAVWPEVMTPDRAFLRNGLPMYLGPTWSVNGVNGTPYVLAACSLIGLPIDRALTVVRALAQVHCDGKVIWVVDAPTQAMLVELLAADTYLAERVFVVQGDGLRRAEVRARMDAATVLCREVASLPEQISLLHGANGAVLDAGHALVDVAGLLDLPFVSLESAQSLVSRRNAHGAALDVRALDGDALNAVLVDARAAAAGHPVLVEPANTSGAAAGIAEHLLAWIDTRQQAAMVA
ncbi:XrtA/PEP-CTERM system-associated ATPase [Sphaerotilus sp.]|uniref:XrtA/PEP-CTERM system-associated ATPase n=1 Tax=Sphaerotilus sp. TaxID=2093942 RepID=UPI00286E2599|nr:XrtA/PEP-CTERM system-associated ATPase [Sphaerotilus sp.]